MKPSELAISLAVLSAGSHHRYANGEWVAANEVRGQLKLFGFDVLAQQVAAWLARMSRVDAPWVERRESPWGDLEYRLTHYGLNDIENRLHLRVREMVV